MTVREIGEWVMRVAGFERISRRVAGAGPWVRPLASLASLTLSVAVPSVVEADTIAFFSTGYGRSSCSAYLQAQQGLNPNEKREFKGERLFVSENAEYDHWILGFVTAMNYRSALDGGRRPDIAAPNVEILGAVQDWCRRNPERAVMDATIAYINARWSAATTKEPAAPSVEAPATVEASYIRIAFQPGLPASDVAALLQAYHATIVEGPSAEGFYRVKIEAALSPSDLQTLIESVKTQVNVVKAVTAD